MYTMYYDPFCPFHKKKKEKSCTINFYLLLYDLTKKKQQNPQTETQTTGQIPNQEYVNTDY